MIKRRPMVVAVVTLLLAVMPLGASAKSWVLDQGYSGDGRLRLTALDTLLPVEEFSVQEIGVHGGQVYAAGFSIENVSTGKSGFIVRTLADGTLDGRFGINGFATWTVKDYDPVGLDFKILSDGGLILSFEPNDHLVVMRWTADGMLDPTFSNDGKRSFPLHAPTSGAGTPEGRTEVAVDQSGRLVVAVESAIIFRRQVQVNVRIYRMLPTGPLDDTFASDGVRRIDLKKWDFVGDVAVDSHNRVLIALASTPKIFDGSAGYLIRLRRNGSADTSFSSDGMVHVGFHRQIVRDRSIPIEIGMAGDVTTVAMTSQDGIFGGARILADGSHDPSYGLHGVVGFTCDCRIDAADVRHGAIVFASGEPAFRPNEQMIAKISRRGNRVDQGTVDLYPKSDSVDFSSVVIAGDAVLVGGGVDPQGPSNDGDALDIKAFVAKVR